MRRENSKAGPHRGTVAGRHLARTLLTLALVAGMAALVPALTQPSLPRNPFTLLGNASIRSGNPLLAGLPEAVTETHAVTVQGVRRTYRSIVSIPVGGRVPLVIVLHGRGQSGSVAASQTGFLGLAQRRWAVLVFPEGEQRSWDAGHGCCGFAGSHRLPDVAFVAAIVADAVHRWPIDVGRVYLVGYSNGGKLAYSAVCAHPTLFAAVATYGAVPLAPCQTGTPAVSFLLAAGSADRVLPLRGRPAGNPPLPAVPQAVDWLRIQDGCPARAQTSRDGSVLIQRWADCTGGAEVDSVVYPGEGHRWPVARASHGSPPVAALMWEFLSRHHAVLRAPAPARLASGTVHKRP